MTENDATNKKARLDAEFERKRSQSSLLGPAQLLVVEVYEMTAAEGSEKAAAIEYLAKALEQSRADDVEAWIRQYLAKYLSRMDDSFLSLVKTEMFEHYVKIEHDSRIGIAVTKGGNKNLAALRIRAGV